MVTSQALWVGPPRSYSPGRVRKIQFIVIHSTEGSEGTTSAENGAAYDKIRTDGTSTHFFVDQDTALREVHDEDRAHHARFHGNEIGIGVELCGRAGQTWEQWHDAASGPMLRIAAREVAVLCQTHGIPPRRLSVAEVRAAWYGDEAGMRPFGICGHIDVTKAFPEDNGTHTDPGPNFPWQEFLAMVADYLEDDMTPEQAAQLAEVHKLVDDGERTGAPNLTPPASNQSSGGGIPIAWLPRQFYEINKTLTELRTSVTVLQTDVTTLSDHLGVVTEDQVAAALQRPEVLAAIAGMLMPKITAAFEQIVESMHFDVPDRTGGGGSDGGGVTP